MLSHGNFLSFLAALEAHPDIQGWREDDSYLSFLPLPHVLERVVIVSMLYAGCFVAYYCFLYLGFIVGIYSKLKMIWSSSNQLSL